MLPGDFSKEMMKPRFRTAAPGDKDQGSEPNKLAEKAGYIKESPA